MATSSVAASTSTYTTRTSTLGLYSSISKFQRQPHVLNRGYM